MSKIETVFSTGSVLYAVIHNPGDGMVWNDLNSAWEAFNSARWAQYAVPLTEQSPTGYYIGTYPAAIVGVLTTEVVYQQGSGSPDPADAPATGIGQSQGVNLVTMHDGYDAVAKLKKSADSMQLGATITGTLTSTSFPTNLTDLTDYTYQGRLLIFTSGALLRQVGNIIGYVASTATITVGGPFTSAPAAGDSFIIV